MDGKVKFCVVGDGRKWDVTLLSTISSTMSHSNTVWMDVPDDLFEYCREWVDNFNLNYLCRLQKLKPNSDFGYCTVVLLDGSECLSLFNCHIIEYRSFGRRRSSPQKFKIKNKIELDFKKIIKVKSTLPLVGYGLSLK
jgi:hypothetical protein